MRWGMIMLVLLCQVATTRVVASDATELREALLLMRRPAILEPVRAEQSCNSKQCTVDIAQISIETRRGRMTIAGKYPVKMLLQARSKKSGLPAVGIAASVPFEKYPRRFSAQTCSSQIPNGSE